MNRLISRLVTFVLVPSLLVDPSICGRGPSPSATGVRGTMFVEQAMGLPSLSVHSPRAPEPAALVRKTSRFAGRSPAAAPPKPSAAGTDASERPLGISPESWWGKLFEILMNMHGKAHFDERVWDNEMRRSYFYNLRTTFLELGEAGIVDEAVMSENIPEEWPRMSVKQLAELVAFRVAPWEEARELINSVAEEIHFFQPNKLRKPEEIRPLIRMMILECIRRYLEATHAQAFMKGKSITSSKLKKALPAHLAQLAAALDDGTELLTDFFTDQIDHLVAGGPIPVIPIAVKVSIYEAHRIYNMLLASGSPFLVRPDFPHARAA